jgi:DNA-directed RNA polymerase specialized sigma24 family protein
MAFFEARGSELPEDHADETIDRVARKIVEGEQIDHPDKYIYGVARLVWLESLRAREKTPVPLDLTATPVAPNYEEQHREQTTKEQNFDCFETCLDELPAAHRSLIVAYYREESGLKLELRKRQAEELNMSLNALRLRASRIRAELSVCIDNCLKDMPQDTKTAIYH